MTSTDRTFAPSTLAEILAPVEVEEFLASCWSENWRYIPGTPDKFAALLPWPALNAILEQHRLDPPRLRLTREGKAVPADTYISYQPNRRASGGAIPRVNAVQLTTHLRNGATLVLDAVDELQAPVTRLAESLERLFRVRVQVNAYAGWRTSHGFDLHWDDHDVFILQVAGRKDWKIYEQTRRYPLAQDVEPATGKPEKVLWEGQLTAGDLLYIPRGWWHVATPLDEPTLHLTVGVNNPTAADFVSWYADRLRAAEVVRRDIPHLRSAVERAAFAEQVRAALLSEWRPELIDEYLADLDAKARPRPHFALPSSAIAGPLRPEARVRINAPRQAALTQTDSVVSFDARGRRWRFAVAARPLLELLLAGEPVTVADLSKSSTAITPGDIETLVQELIEQGVVIYCA